MFPGTLFSCYIYKLESSLFIVKKGRNDQSRTEFSMIPNDSFWD
jgi:hypothetical protein